MGMKKFVLGAAGRKSLTQPNSCHGFAPSPSSVKMLLVQAESERGTWTDGRVRWSQGIQGLEVLLDQVALIFNPDR